MDICFKLDICFNPNHFCQFIEVCWWIVWCSLLSLMVSAKKLCNSWNRILRESWKMICERGMLCFCYQPTHHPLTPHFAIVHNTLHLSATTNTYYQMHCSIRLPSANALQMQMQMHCSITFAQCSATSHTWEEHNTEQFCVLMNNRQSAHTFSSVQFIREWNERITELWDKLQHIDLPHCDKQFSVEQNGKERPITMLRPPIVLRKGK